MSLISLDPSTDWEAIAEQIILERDKIRETLAGRTWILEASLTDAGLILKRLPDA